VVNPEEYATMSDDELFDVIQKELYVNEAVADAAFYHKKSAEYLERAVYVCPACGLSTFESHNDIVRCTRCALSARYLPTKELCGVEGDLPFRFVLDWYNYQKDFVNALDVRLYVDEPMYREQTKFSRVIPCKKKICLCKKASGSLFGDRIIIDADGEVYSFPFDQTSAVTVLGRNKLNIYHGDDIFQLKGSKRFNALKYVHIFHRYQNVSKGDGHGKFLGL
jgi:ribosomal protein S27AE